jgi:hypothetical protein
MHQAARLQFERIVREFARWRAVPQHERPPAPGWWWGPALEVAGARQPMPPNWCARLELPLDASFDDGAKVLLASLAHQTTMTWPGNFPGVTRYSEPDEREV